MKVVGLCGQSGSGKGTVCSFFSELNVTSIDTDKVYHNIISVNSECTEELVDHFGPEIFNDPGIDRTALRKLAFSSEENLQLLNKITHKHILNAVRREIERIKSENTVDGILIDAPLLFESGFDKECDCTLAVVSSEEIKIERIMKRDGISREQASVRLSSQISEDELKNRCDYVIVNNSDAKTLRDSVRELKKIIFD